MLVSAFSLLSIFANQSSATTSAGPSHQQTEVLFISFADPDLPDLADMVEEIQTQILEGRATPIHFSFEYLDPSLPISDPLQKRKVQTYLLERYHGHSFKLVIAIGEQAAVFMEDSRAKLFPEASVLFFVVDPIDARKWLSARSGRTGIVQDADYAATLKLALAQNPGTRHVVLISGSSESEKLTLKRARDQFRSYEPTVDFSAWTDVTFLDVGSRLVNLRPDTVVVFLNFLSDAAGEQFVPAQILPGLAKRATRPIYGVFSSFVGRGAVGGSVADLREVGRMLGQSAVSILNGRNPEHIAVARGQFQRYVFDWPQLRRWGIPEDRLPPGSSVLHWQTSPWELYRWRIFGLLTAIAIEALLILLLLHTRARQRAAEDKLLQKKEELSEAQRLARIGSWHWNPRTDELTFSDTLYDIIGIDPSTTLTFETQAQFLSPDSWGRLKQSIEKALHSGETCELALEASRSDGRHLWLTLRGEVVRDEKRGIIELRGTLQDITQEKKAEEVLLRYAAIVESSTDAIVSEDLSGTILTWNLGAQQLFELTQEEAVGQPISIIIPPLMQAEAQGVVRRVRNGEKIQSYRAVRQNKAGSKVNVSITVSPVKDQQGTIIGCSTIMRDIGELMRAQDDLNQSEQKFAKAFRRAPLAIAITSTGTHKYVDVNETFERWSGFRRDEVIGRTPLELKIWEDPSDRDKAAKRLLMDTSIHELECRFRSKDGKRLVGLVSAELIEINGEQCILSVVADITDRKRAEQKLQESEKRFRLMADSAPVLMWLSDANKLCTDFNQEWLRFTGRTMKDELGDGWTENVHPDDLQSCVRTYTRAFDDRRQFVMEYRLRRHDGQYRWLMDRGVPRFLDDGTFAGYIGCCIDITDEKEAKAARAELSGRLIHAQEEERARIARELHDDINQRLALLANGLQEVERNSDQSEQSEERKQVRELWQATNDIANDVQQLSHQLHPSKLHYLGLASAIRELCQEFSKLHKTEVQCTAHNIPKHLDETLALGLYRAVQEALRNVAKHSQAHQVKVELAADAKQLRLRVSDDGVGFDPELARNSHGLGLISMQERLRLVGGEFSLWSRPSLGTQIEGVVPLAEHYVKSA